MVGEETDYRLERVGRRQLIACAAVAVMILSGLSVFVVLASGPAAAAGPFRSLRIGINPLVITTLNPLKITLADEYVVVYNVYSTLITYDKTYHAIPDLATHWSLAPDSRTWTFDLVQGAYFTSPLSPGDRSHPVTADDVVYSFQLQSATKGSILHSYTAAITSVTKTGPYQVQIVTNGPFAGMYSSASAIPILPQYVQSQVGRQPRLRGRVFHQCDHARVGRRIRLHVYGESGPAQRYVPTCGRHEHRQTEAGRRRPPRVWQRGGHVGPRRQPVALQHPRGRAIPVRPRGRPGPPQRPRLGLRQHRRQQAGRDAAVPQGCEWQSHRRARRTFLHAEHPPAVGDRGEGHRGLACTGGNPDHRFPLAHQPGLRPLQHHPDERVPVER